MTRQYLYICLFIYLISCNTEVHQTRQSGFNDIVQTNEVSQQICDTVQSTQEELIGKIYRKHYEIPEFKNLNGGGYLIGDYENGYEYKGEAYSLEILREDYIGVKYILLTKTHSRVNGKANFKILDMLKIKKELENPVAFISHNVNENGKKDVELFSLVEYDNYEDIKKVFKVWRANRELEKIQEIKDLSSIEVIGPDY